VVGTVVLRQECLGERVVQRRVVDGTTEAGGGLHHAVRVGGGTIILGAVQVDEGASEAGDRYVGDLVSHVVDARGEGVAILEDLRRARADAPRDLRRRLRPPVGDRDQYRKAH
jgi:hypothetical protein